MHLQAYDYVGIAAYMAVMVWIAWLTRRIQRFHEYALASKQLPAFLLFASLAATYVGPGFTMGAVDKASTTGMYNYFLFLPYALQTYLVGVFLAPRLATFEGCSTIGDVMGRVYNPFTQILAGVSSVGICILFTAYLGKVGGTLLMSATGISFSAGVAVFTTASVFYTIFGGLRASVLTDTVQFILFSLIIPLVAIAAFFHPAVDLQTVAPAVTKLTPEAWTKDTALGAIAVALSFLLGETLIPPYANRALAAPSAVASKRAFVWGGLYCVFWLAVVTGIGLVAPHVLPAGAERGEATIYSMTKTVLPAGFFGALVIAIIAVIMSSQDSVINAGTVAFTRDLVAPFKTLSESAQMNLSRTFCVVIALAGITIAAWLPTIIAALLLIYSLWAPTVLVPLVLGLLLKQPGKHAAWSAMLAGGLTSVLWQFWFKNPHSIPPILPGLAASAAAFILGHLLSSPKQAPFPKKTV